jgi:transposase
MSPNANVYVGVDVAKATLQFHGPCARSTTQIPNQSKSVLRLLRTLRAAYPSLHLICEATGGFERVLTAAAHALGIPGTIVDPWRVRRFAQSVGCLEKTDAIDAAVLCRYGQAVQPPATSRQDEAHQTLRQWVQLRDHYIAQLRQEQTFLSSLPEPAQQRLVQAQCRHLTQLIETLEAKIEAFLQAQAPELNDRVQTLCLVTGVAWRSATALLAYLPELGRCNQAQIAKLSGLAPMPDDSGPRHGPRHITRGRAPVRRILYMLALVAARFNEHSKTFYLRLRAAGKPPKVALIAVARKLLVFLNSLLKPASAPS